MGTSLLDVPANNNGLGLNVSSVIKSVAGGAADVARSQIRTVVLRSNVSPDIVLTPEQALGPDQGGVQRRGGFQEFLWSWAKPEIEVNTAFGSVRVAPWGEPTTNLFWPTVILGTAGAVAIGVLAYRGLKKELEK